MREHPKIFIVDDEEDVLLTLRRGLENHGFVVDTYCDPIVALSNLNAGVYSICLIDLRLPKMNGLELSLRIRKIDKSVKICLITGFPAYYERLLEENPEMDFTCFIKKPVSIDILSKRLKAELEIKNSGHY